MPALYELNGHDIVRVHEVAIGPTSLGRDLANEIVLHEPSVSRFHCRIVVDRSGTWVEDCRSQNGTHVGGRQIDAAARLLSGSRLQLGRLSLVYWDDVSTDPTINAAKDQEVLPRSPIDVTCQFRVWWRIDWNCLAWGWRIRRR